jgi:ribosomal protein S18 acetylase RimI-like enzyme
MGPSYEIRPATDAYRPAVGEIYAALFRGDIERIWGWDETWQRENFAAEWEASETRIIEVAGRLAGYLQRQFREDHDYLLSLGLIPEMQGRGIGSSIMQGLQNRKTPE